MDTEALVIGSGLAGLVLALKVADQSKVLLCTKTDLKTTNSAMAQGGIAAVMSEEDSFDQHVSDTLTAGAGLCDPTVVRNIIEAGPDRIQDLIGWGVKFDLNSSAQIDLTREGGHSMRRILHIADHTGQDVHAHVLNAVLRHPNIKILENHYAIDLIVDGDLCLGAYVLNRLSGEVFSILASATFLATGELVKFICIHRIGAVQPAMESRWPIELARESRIWNLCSFTRPVYFIRRHVIS